MRHTYARHCYRISDGKRFTESRDIEGVQVAIELGNSGRAGNRLDFLELVNRWNRAGIGGPDSNFVYTYVAE